MAVPGNDVETEEIYAFFRNAFILSAKSLWIFYTLRAEIIVIMTFCWVMSTIFSEIYGS